MTTVAEALMAMLGRCDRARTLDNVGFNRDDAQFAHSVGGYYQRNGRMTPRQERAVHSMLETYQSQLEELGYEYGELELETPEPEDPIENAEMWIGDTEYGKKIMVQFPYSSKIKDQLMDLPWNETHRSWNDDHDAWTLDTNETSLGGLEAIGFDIPEEVRKEIVPWDEVKHVIRLDSVESRITGNLQGYVNDQLNNRLAFRPEGHEYSHAFQVGSWDGYIRLYHQYNQTFPTGLLPMVEDVLEQNHVEYEIVDERDVGEQIPLEWNGPDMRDYQEDAVEKCLERGSGFIVMPTGSGKTLLALRIIHECSLKTIIFVHRQELLYQWQDRIRKNLGYDPGIIGDGHYEERDITVAMLQTSHQNPPEGEYDVMFCDEGHHIPADTFEETVSKIPAKHRFSLSATMRREDGKEMMLWSQTGTAVVEVGVYDLVDSGYLAMPKFVILDYNVRVGGSDWHDEYRSLVRCEARNQMIADYVAEKHKEGHRCYVDVKRIKHGEKLVDLLRRRGVSARFISGSSSTDARQEALSTFEDDNFVLVSTLIKEGVDLPAMSLVLLAGGGKSGIQVIQTVGRALRPKPGNNEALVVDLKDRGHYTGDHYYQRKRVMEDYYDGLYEPEVVKR